VYKVISFSLLQSLINIIFSGLGTIKQKVGLDAASKKQRLLLNKAHLTPQPSQVVSLDVMAIHKNDSLIGVIQSENQLDNGGLAAAGLPQ